MPNSLHLVLVPAILLAWAGGVVLAVNAPRKATEPQASKRLVLHDFERESLVGNLGGMVKSWIRGDGEVRLSLTPMTQTENPGGNQALHFGYALGEEGGTTSTVGLQLDLNGLDASDYDHLELRVRGDVSAGFAEAFKVQFLRPSNLAPKMKESGSYVITGIDGGWQRIRIPLNIMNGIRDWTRLKHFVVALQYLRTNPLSGAYFIDDIALIRTGNPGPSIDDPVIPVAKKAWEAARGGEAASKPFVRDRLTELPSRRLLNVRELPDDPRELLMRVARDTWRGIDGMTDRENGMPVDNILLPSKGRIEEGLKVGDYTNITNIGMYLMSVVAANELGFIDRKGAVGRMERVLGTLGKLETHEGFFFNYYDAISLERTSNFISFVDSSWLTAGLMVVRAAFPELGEQATKLIRQVDYGKLYDEVEQMMSHGYYVNIDYPSEYHYGMLYTESRVGSLIAIGKGDVPETHWFRMMRSLPKEFDWQRQTPVDWKTQRIDGIEVKVGHYRWKDMEYVPSWGGSMFEALMPTLVVNETRYAPRSLGENDRRHVDVQLRYATEVLDYPVWGLSPSSTVPNDGYGEFGVKVLGARGYGGGAVTPHATLLALEVSPDRAVANLKSLLNRFDIYGEFGLYDAVDPESGEVSYKYLVLDQAMSFIALANYLAENSIQDYFASDPIAVRGFAVLGDERFFD
ncbi:MAG: DUF3131 domain-containing protein [Gammaproteobacteria bacterium]|jgi:hypothetical protein|nr:DUF3131 domain-containing protein [Gammaproteobacteria bacterium]